MSIIKRTVASPRSYLASQDRILVIPEQRVGWMPSIRTGYHGSEFNDVLMATLVRRVV